MLVIGQFYIFSLNGDMIQYLQSSISPIEIGSKWNCVIVNSLLFWKLMHFSQKYDWVPLILDTENVYQRETVEYFSLQNIVKMVLPENEAVR